MRLAGISAVALVTVGVALVFAANIATKRLVIKDNANPAKRLILVKSTDAALVFAAGDDPISNGAAIHVYSAVEDFCLSLAGGAGWTNMGGTKWKYLNTSTKTLVLQGNAKLVAKIKSQSTYSLAGSPQGAVNVQVQIGNGPRSCMRCSAPKKDTTAKFIASLCAPATCDPEPSTCNPPTTTSTTTTVTTSTTTTTCGSPLGAFVKGALTPTLGRFNYNLTLGLAGANAACNINFPGTHACTYAELTSAATTDLCLLKDTAMNPVNSFWAIDGAAPPLQQCNDDAIGGSGLNWEYGTAHTASRGNKVALTNNSGVLLPLQVSVQCNISGTSNVGCCQ
jgi:hypothetical protein